MAKLSQSKLAAIAFIDAAHNAGFSVQAKSAGVIAIHRYFSPGDADAYTGADMMGPGVLGRLNARGGSQWGTDGASIGGYVGLRRGQYTLNQSGVPLRLHKAIREILDGRDSAQNAAVGQRA